MGFVVFQGTRQDGGYACLEVIAHHPRLVCPAEASPREVDHGGRVFSDANAVRAHPPLDQLVKGSGRDEDVVVTAVHLTLPTFLRAKFITLNGDSLSAFVRFNRFVNVLGNDRVPYLRVRPTQHVDDDLRGDLRVLFQSLLANMDPCASAYFSVLWGFVYLRAVVCLPFGRAGLYVRLRVVGSILFLRGTVFVFVRETLFRADVSRRRIFRSLLLQFVVAGCFPISACRRGTFGDQVLAVMCLYQARPRDRDRWRLLCFGLVRAVFICRLVFCLREVRLLSCFHRFASSKSTIRVRGAGRLYRCAQGVWVGRRGVATRRAINCVQVFRRATRALCRRRSLKCFIKKFKRYVGLVRHEDDGLSSALLRFGVYHAPSIRWQVRNARPQACVRASCQDFQVPGNGQRVYAVFYFYFRVRSANFIRGFFRSLQQNSVVFQKKFRYLRGRVNGGARVFAQRKLGAHFSLGAS